MKKLVLIAAGMFLNVISLCAQTNNTLVVFSEGGEPFYLILNGLRQNDVAATNVKAVGLNQSAYKAKVIFEQKGIPDADKSLYMAWEGNPANNMEFVCSIKKDKKGNYKWSFVSTAPISANSAYASIQPSYPGGSATTATTVNTNENTQVNATTNTNVNTTASTNGTIGMNTSVGVNDNTSNTSTTVTTTTTTTQGTNGVNMGVNMNGTGININMNISDPLLTGNGQTSTTTTSTTTTYTTSSTTVSSTGNPTTTTTYSASSTTTGTGSPNTITTTTNYSDNAHSTGSNNSSATGCGWAMGSGDFESAKKSIAAKSFEDSKLTVAKQILNSNCMNTAQVKEIMDQFSFEQTKLDWAKYAYTKTTDRNNYFKINDGFTFEASIDDLNDYISKIK